MFLKNKAVLSLTLGLAMVYGAGTMSAFAAPNDQLPEKPPVIQNQDQNQNNYPKINAEKCKNPNHHQDPNCKKNHPFAEKCNIDDKKPLPPKDNQEKKPVSPKKHDEKKPINPELQNPQDNPNQNR
ncbi:hypothetical protein [Sporomusa aerivorans]|uniref:hypothetical protein n=1 Tax=Sporomusa aerivorans TaxID=204936 RepID=UPI00352AA129